MNENRHGATARRQIIFLLTSGVAFFVALRRKKRAGQKFAPRPKRLYSYRKNPSVCHTVWGTKEQQQGKGTLHLDPPNTLGGRRCAPPTLLPLIIFKAIMSHVNNSNSRSNRNSKIWLENQSKT